ncbi:hypothetical protein AAEH72_19080 [Shewanella xiamenensis]|uniref:hypothetical protein n=1 Tax=Shewanella xiamenensis TaxID=332186 RepID=UPI00313AE95E
MKIDIHVHTKKTKRGDANTRNVSPEDFTSIVQSTDVKILAITNHNEFDFHQYENILICAKDEFQVWPGVELDIIENGKRSHLLVIVSPSNAIDFYNTIRSLRGDLTADEFTISIEDVYISFKKLDPIYIAHYLAKKPAMDETTIQKMVSLGINEKRIIKEATNSISAGIFIEHGHRSIYGSDIHDWSKYVETSENLPELRLQVDSFEQFRLLLEKDGSTIDTVLSKKFSEELNLIPFEDNTTISIKAYNDINILFGPKGTGKTKILEAVARHYSSKGITAKVFESGPDKLSDKYDLKGQNIDTNISYDNFNECNIEISKIKSSVEKDVTIIQKYRDFFSTENKNRNSQLIKIKEIPNISESIEKNNFEKHYETKTELYNFIKYIKDNQVINEIETKENINVILNNLNSLHSKLKKSSIENFIFWKSTTLSNNAINVFNIQVSRKTGVLSKPTTTGFKEYALNRIAIRRNTKKINTNINKILSDTNELVGTLGENKGDLYCVTSYFIQDGTLTDGNYTPLRTIKKNEQKDFSKLIEEIYNNSLSENLFESIIKLNNLEDIKKINNISDLIIYWRRFSLNGATYSPSNGERSMLNLHSELAEDKEIYILDEPERSLGNEYINDVIIPLINEKALQGKKIFISTHDANVAVRTLPYNSIYRCHNQSGYETYIGNPFSNHLQNTRETSKKLDWKTTSMRTLEGGENAFGERGGVYGKY